MSPCLMLNMRVKKLGYKLAGIDRQKLIQATQNGSKTKGFPRCHKTVDRDIIFKK